MNRLNFSHVVRLSAILLGLIAFASHSFAANGFTWTAPVPNVNEATVGSGVSYSVATHLTSGAGANITIYKKGSYFASAFGGVSASTSDVGPATITYVATATLPYMPYTTYSDSYTVHITAAAIQTNFSTSSSFACDGQSHTVSVAVTPNNATYYTSGTWSATNVGTYTAGAQAYGVYTGSNFNLVWYITRGTASTPTISASSSSVAAGGSITFTASGGSTGSYSWGGAASGSGSQKTVTFSTPGTYTVTVQDPGNTNFGASGTASVSVTANVKAVSFSIGGPFTYDGTTKNPTVTSTPSDATYTLSGTPSATNAGTYTVTATGNGNYTGVVNNLSWTINKATASKPTISPSSASYSGSGSGSFSASGGSTGNYSWSCSSSASISGSGSSVTANFPSMGTHWVGVQDPGNSNYNASSIAYSSITVNALSTTFYIASYQFTYDGREKDITPYIRTNPSGATFTTGGTPQATGAGTWTASASAYGAYTGSNSSLTWTIGKASGATPSASPSSVSVNPGGSVSITVSGGTTGGYYWSGVASGTGTSISFTASTTPGTYYEYVYDGGNVNYGQSATVTIPINVAAPPSISVQPVSQSVTAGSNVTFSVTASGSGTLSYQWYVGGSAISGATAASYAIAGVQASQAGSYTVKVTNSAGNVTSTAATLTVNTGPVIATQPSNVSITAGQTAVFTVVATGSPTPTYQWRKAGSNIAGATSSTLTLTNVQLSDAVSYDVVVTNTAGYVTSSAVTLALSPTIATQPSNVSITAGQTAVFTVAATGSPTPTYQWRKAGSNIAGATSATLTLTNVQASDAASYDVVVSNSAGSVTSSAATLTLNSAPTITTPPTSQTVNTGVEVTFTVVATGSGTLSYQWNKNGTAISGATAASYQIANVQTTHGGSYTVTVTNSVGSVTSSAATLTVSAGTAPDTNNDTKLTIHIPLLP